ncbi:MAG: ribose-phosphate diphosphokinase [Moritella sp.]|uniref:ribose-phosphate diphosphokinase n=1 Tax=Moritella sp. TaxID=78556 RepID=UPI0029B0BC73|nr:ribose-phosphate diphosphokinase [Moritella sp.]MDX2322029.1 ribose-phosphate diphosphokinase [Moritella sp.]
MSVTSKTPILFSLAEHPLQAPLCQRLPAMNGQYSYRRFPDGESYLRIDTGVQDRDCIVLADLSHPDDKYLQLLFLVATLHELGAASVGLVAPYLCYMRQDKRFTTGEAVTSRIFASQLSQQIDWLVTVDPHLHRYHSLDEIYSIPNQVVHAEPLLIHWLLSQKTMLLVGPDAESQQWVSQVAKTCNHPYVVGSKQRLGDRNVIVSLPDLSDFKEYTAVIIDDVIASGQTVLKCIDALHLQGIKQIFCASIHGIFVDGVDELLIERGVTKLITSNSIPHSSNLLDLSDILVAPINHSIASVADDNSSL